MRSALFWGFTQRRMVITLPTFRDNLPVPSSSLDCLDLEDGTDRFSRKVGNKLPSYSAQNPRRAQISLIVWRKTDY